MKKKQLLLSLCLWLLFNGGVTLIRFWVQAMGLYPDPSVNRSADAHGEAWWQRLCYRRGQPDDFLKGTIQDLCVAGDHILH